MDELAIIGGGCAGLALAAGLSATLEDMGGPAVLLEGRSQYSYDRTWGYWNLEDHPYQHLERFHWRRWKLRYRGEELVRESQLYPYALLPSGLYYRTALGRIEHTQQIRIHRGCEVQGFQHNRKGWNIATSQGMRKARVLIDARAGAMAPKGLLQHFLGQYVQVADKVFDPHTLTLMDFDVDQSRGIHFLYLLPLSPDSAYVADTYFTRHPLDKESHRTQIRAWMRARYGVSQYEVDGEEQGVIPMSCGYAPRTLGPKGFAIGGAGGAIKASSGYAFTAIQRQVEGYVRRIEHYRDWCSPPAPRPRGLEWLDRIFLGFMLDHPARMPEVFMALFRHCEADALVRFLADRPSAADVAQVLRAVPALGMGAAALRHLRCWTV